MKKVTVVIPTYNVEKYIRKCLDSLVAQDSDEFEVLAINDGSPANEQPIIDEYCAKYPFIHTIVKENGGYGSVLALAIQTITTPYMLICDPDDYLAPHAISTLLKASQNESMDIVIGAKNLVYFDNAEEKYDISYNQNFVTLKENEVYLKKSQAYNDLLYVDPSPHSKLYRVSMLKEICFPKKISFTDNILYFIGLLNAEKVVYISDPLAYYLIDREGNTMTDVKVGVIKAWRLVELSILQQAANIKDVPDMFYYRMFETYKFIMYDKVVKCNKQDPEFQPALYSLYDIIKELLPYRDSIMTYYRQKYNAGFVEKFRDNQLLNKNTSKKTFDKMMKKYL